MKTYDMQDPIYKTGDDDRCPACGAALVRYHDMNFMDGVVQFTYTCPKCWHMLTFNYHLNNIVDEDG